MMIVLIGKLAQTFPDHTFYEYASLLLGNILGKIISFFLVLFIIINSAVDMYLVTSSIMGVFYILTPSWQIFLLMTGSAVLLSWYGVVNLARMTPVLSILLILMTIIITLFLTQSVQIGYFRPVRVTDIQFTSMEFWVAIGSFRTAIFLGVLLPYVQHGTKVVKNTLLSFWLAWIIVFLFVAFPVLLFSVEGAAILERPFPYFLSVIRIQNFPFDRIHTFARMLYSVNVLITVGIAFFAGGLLLKQIFSNGDKHNYTAVRPFILITAGMTLILLFLIKNNATGIEFINISIISLLTFAWGSFLLLWIVKWSRHI